jgi:hypothetical protein
MHDETQWQPASNWRQWCQFCCAVGCVEFQAGVFCCRKCGRTWKPDPPREEDDHSV